MKKFSFLILFSFLAIVSMAQIRYQRVLLQLENQSPLFSALHQKMEAEQKAVNAGALIENPEMEVGYLFGNPDVTGNRIDFSVSQSFEFPTVYSHKKRIREIETHQAQISYRQQRLELLMAAQHLCADIVYQNLRVGLFSRCAANADTLADLYARRFETGDCNILDYNRVQIERAEAQNNLRMAIIERDLLLNQLQVLNGGQPIDFDQQSFDPVNLPVNFNSWYDEFDRSYPELDQMRSEIEKGQSEINMTKAANLPNFSLGYASESVPGEPFRGPVVGLTLPLWQNKGQVNRAKAAHQVASVQLENAQSRFRNEQWGRYNKILAMSQNVAQMRQLIDNHNSVELLRKSFESGEISLEHYLLELDFYFDAEQNVIDAQREIEHSAIDFFSLTE